MKPSLTPLRYPGGKSWLLGYLERFISFNNLKVETLIEPFGGSAAISIGLLQRKIVKQAFVAELDPLIVSFWKMALERNDELIDRISALDITLDTWHNMKKYLNDKRTDRDNEMDQAVAFLFLNRTNYSGIIKGGPLGGKGQKSQYKINCRFNKSKIVQKIKMIEELEGKLHVIESDGLRFMNKITAKVPDNLVFYLDPPYYEAGKVLYRHYFKEKDHIELSDFLKSLDIPWLLSYDNADFIKNLYKERVSSPVYTDYQSGHFKKGVKELLISNYIIPPFAPEISLRQDILTMGNTSQTLQNIKS